MDPKRFTRRLIALGAAMFLCALVFVITLFDAQIVNGDDYLDKSIRTNAKTETVKASRGILTDRNGKVLVSNRAVYTLNFDSSLVSSDELNDALLRVIELMNAQGVEIKDALPLARTSPYAYDTANGSAKTLVKYLVSLKWINEKNVGDDGLPTTLTGSALYLKLRSEYGIDETLPNSTVRTLIGLRYSLASAKMNGSTTFEFASDVDVSLISLIKDGNYAGVQVDTSSVRVYETDYAAHVLGYTGSIQDWDDYKDKDGYTLASTVGISGVESNLGTAIRTGVVLLMSWVMVFVTGKQGALKAIPKNELFFICLSGLATGGSWLCYYKALQDGPASVVVPIDKLSILVTVLFSYLVFREKLTKKSALGLAGIVAGTLLMLF